MGCASRRLAASVAALALLATTGGAGGDSVGNPAAAIAAAAGHPAALHLRGEVTATRDGAPATLTLEVAGPQRLERICAAELCSGSWFDGQRRYDFGPNETPYPERGAENGAERTYAAIASTAFGEPAFTRSGGTVRRLISAANELRFAVTAPAGAPLVAVADARTSRLTGTELPDGTAFRAVEASPEGSVLLYGARHYSAVERAAAAALVAPSGPLLRVSGTQRLEARSAQLPIVDCRVGGHSAGCLIDTGTTPSAVTLDFAEALGLEPRGRIEIAGLHPYLTGAVKAGPVVLGSARIERLHFAVIPHAAAAAFDVILGSDALAGLRVTFGSDLRQIEIAPPRGAGPGAQIPLEFGSGVPYAHVQLGSAAVPEAMLIDTGDTATLSIGYDRYRRDFGLFDVRTGGSAHGLGAGSTDILAGVLDRAQIAGATFADVPIDAVRGQHVGHVGYGLRSYCRPLIVDLGAGRAECGADGQAP